MLTVHLAATAAMVGLLWFVQLVYYPLFALVGPDGFVEYEHSHQQRTSYVVGPLMAPRGSPQCGLRSPRHLASLASGHCSGWLSSG